jgi:hypothetical protein
MAWNPSLSLNPEFVRGLRTTLPRRRALFVVGLTVVLLAAGGWLIWNKSAPYIPLYGLDDAEREARMFALQVERFGGTSYVILTVALFALLFMLAPAMTGLSFVQERLRGTAIFQQMSLLSPLRLASGKFWGAGALAYFVALMLLPCALAAAWLGHWNAPSVVRVYLFLLFGGFAWQALGLYASAALSGPTERALRGGLLVGPLVAVGGAVTAAALSRFYTADYEEMAAWLERVRSGDDPATYMYDYYQSFWWHFYGVRIPAYAVVLGLLAFVGVWAFVGAVRRVKAWQLIPVGPRVAWLFLAGAGLLVTGLLWGRHVDDSVPVERLQMFMLLAWGAVAAAAGGSALTRGRLREWWSAERDPLALLQRAEIKASAATILVVSGGALAGLLALWASYHVGPSGERLRYGFKWELACVALGFALTLVATLAFVQFCAMFRFRVGGWAGVALLVLLYAFAGVAGLMFKERDNTAALLNPLAYAEVVTKGDYYLDSTFYSETDDTALDGVKARYRRADGVLVPPEYVPRRGAHFERGSAAVRGLAAQSALALLFVYLAGLKWRSTRRDMLRDAEA